MAWNRWLLGALLLLPMGLGHATSKALLIGVGDVQGFPLPAIDVDIENMRKVATILGFKPADIRVLLDQDATNANVRANLTGWLREGVGPKDLVLIYFSGHGTRVADAASAGGVDDALVMHDAVFRNKRLENVLLGRQLGAAIANIPSQNVLVLVDACHSGSATRSLRLPDMRLGTSVAVKRFFYYPGMPPASIPGTATRGLTVTRAPNVADGSENYASLSAARDDEVATGTEQGGMFTLGVVDEVEQSWRDGKHPTLDDLRVASTQYIAAHLSEADRSHPVADGNPRIIRGELPLVPQQNGLGPNWQALVALAGKGQPLTVSSPNGTQTHIGDQIVLQVDVPQHGYLNVVTVDSKDRPTVLYPNEFNPSNEVQPGQFRFPTPQMKFLVRASEPTGPSLVVAFLTANPVNLLDLGVEGKDGTGKMQQAFTEVNGRGTRALVIESTQPHVYSGSLTMQVDPAPAHAASAASGTHSSGASSASGNRNPRVRQAPG